MFSDSYLKEMPCSSIVDYIESTTKTEMSEEQISAIYQMFNTCDIHLCQYRKPKTTIKFFMRLTMPLHFLIVIFLLCTVLPVKWLITGHFKLDKTKGKFGKWFAKWTDILYFN